MIKSDIKSSNLLLQADFNDIEDLCATAKMWDLDFRLLGKPSVAGSAGALLQIAAGDLAYGFCGLNANVDQYGSNSPDLVTFVVMETSVRELWWRHEECGQDEILVYRPGDEIRCISSSGSGVHTISVSEARIEAMCADLNLADPNIGRMPAVYRLPNHIYCETRNQLRAFRAGQIA